MERKNGVSFTLVLIIGLVCGICFFPENHNQDTTTLVGDNVKDDEVERVSTESEEYIPILIIF